jgi:two-component system response regulator HydG
MSEPMRILIVDDDHNMARTLADILTASGYAVDTAASSEEGLAKLDALPFGCVLSDIRMPGTDGVQFQRVIKDKRPGTPVILMTAYADQDLMAQGKIQGALAILDKPLNIPLLLLMLRMVAAGNYSK